MGSTKKKHQKGDWSDIFHVLEDSTGRAARGGESDIAVRGDRSVSDSRDWLSDSNDWLGIIIHLHLSDIAVRGDRSVSDSRDWLSDSNDWLGIIIHLHLSSHNAQ